ncbi:MAG: hypothetical protein EOO90_15450 [Pedobacter sp.]|nr:MAG: hypothetical protein EOO90_15450 [Pedobacter sp.]
MRNLITLLLLFSSIFTVNAQSQKGVLRGTLIDSATAKPLLYATVSVYKDTTLLGYKLSDEKGSFAVSNLPIATGLRIVVTFTGYAIRRQSFSIGQDKSEVELGKILMIPSSLNLNEVIIRGERPPVMISKDTIEFNAAAFKTLPDALVEDLLRKLPGVNVDKDGNIKVNGRNVSTIYVDGKEFFGGDVRIASKNLPSNIIDKVQVTNDAQALRFNPFIPEAEIPQVINLKLKPDIKKGAFGKLYAGGGIKDRGEIGALINVFRDTTQISILGYANNLNKASFSFVDIRSIGGFGRSGWGNASGNGMGGLSIDKVSFGGAGNGLMKSWGGGANFNTIINKKMNFSLNYFHGAVNSNYNELRNVQQSYKDTLLTTRQNMHQLSTNYAHMVSTRFEFDISPKFRLEFRPNLIFSKEDGNQLYNINSFVNHQSLLNESDNNQRLDNGGISLLTYTQLITKFQKKGRSMFIMNFSTLDDANNNQFNSIENTFYEPTRQTFLNQLRRTDAKTFNNNFSLRYSDLIAKDLVFSTGLSSNYFDNRNDLGTFLENNMGEYEVLVPSLTEDYRRQGMRNSANAGVRWKYKKLTLTPMLGLITYDARNSFSTTQAINQHFRIFWPMLDVGLGIFNLSYQKQMREPSFVNLQPVANNTNTLFIRQGNPDLRPAVDNLLNFTLRKYDTKRNMTYNFGLNGSQIKDATIISRTVGANGVQTTLPINVDGTWSVGNSFSFQKDWKMTNQRQVSFIASSSSTFNRSMVLINGIESDLKLLIIRPSVELRLNLNDKFEFNQAYTLAHSVSRYESSEFLSQALSFHDSKSELIYRMAQSLVWESSLDYRYNTNSVPGLLKSYYRWNAGVTYIFLKGRKGQLKLSVNDILDQNIIATRSVRENLIEDFQGSTIRRYGLLSFTYNIRNFGGKVGGKNSLFGF